MEEQHEPLQSINEPKLEDAEPQSPNNNSKKKRWVFLGVAALVVVSVILSLLYLSESENSDSASGKQNTEMTESPSVDESKTSPESGIFGNTIAYKVGADAITDGDVWVAKADGSGKRQITKIGDISSVYSWSPDNKYILVRLGRAFGFVEAASGNVITLKSFKDSDTSIEPASNFIWLSNDKIGYVYDGDLYTTDASDNTIKAYSLPRIDNTTPYSNYELSSDGKYVAFWTQGIQGPMNLSVAMTSDPSNITKLLDSSSGVHNWVGSNLYFEDGKKLMMYSMNGSSKAIKTLTDANRFMGATISLDGKYAAYTLEFPDTAPNSADGNYAYPIIKLYTLELETGLEKEVLTMPADTNTVNLGFRTDSGAFAYSTAGSGYGAIKVINTGDYAEVDICQEECQDPAWQN